MAFKRRKSWHDPFSPNGKISEFLTEVQRKYPRHSGVADALSEAKYVQELLTAKAEANKEIEDTQKKIESLKQQMPQAKGGASLENDQALKQLEKRLADLTAKLSQLDELNLQLKEEREKAAGLTQEIEDGKQREKELMIKISAGAKIPPLLLITSPEDGSQNETGSVRLTGAAEDDRGLLQFEVLVNGRLLEVAEPRGIRPIFIPRPCPCGRSRTSSAASARSALFSSPTPATAGPAAAAQSA